MAEEKKQKCAAGAPMWMTTFADLMSLLMCFFVLLLSFSNMDRMKFKVVAGSLEKAFGIQKEMPIMEMPRGQEMLSRDFQTVPFDVQTKIMDMVSEEIASGVIEAEPAPADLTLRIKDAIVFDLGRARIKPQFYPVLDKLGKIFVDLDLAVVVGGHTDNVPVRKGGEFDSNWELSAARAVNIVEYLEERFKIPAERLSAGGFADGQPLVANDTPALRAQNRRVEFKVRPLPTSKPLGDLDIVRQ